MEGLVMDQIYKKLKGNSFVDSIVQEVRMFKIKD